MKQRSLALLALGSASICAVVFTACGGDSNNGDSGVNDATTNDVVTNDAPQNNDTGPNDTGTTDGGTNDVVNIDTGCAPGPNCQQCCATANPDAAAFVRTTEEACACTTPGDCNTAQTCKNNLCAGMNVGGGCLACLLDKDAGDCRAKGVAACESDPSCQPLAQCVAQCGSAIKDAGGGG